MPSSTGTAPPPRPGGVSPVVRRRRVAVFGFAVVVVIVLIAAVGSHKSSGKTHVTVAKHHRTIPSLTPTERAAAVVKAEENAVNSVLAYTPAVTSGGSHGNELALTFDDGPGPYTQQLVGTLNRLHVRATFFAIGEQERYFSPGTLAEMQSGDVVGDHTETHPMMATLSPHEQHEELFDQMAQIQLLGGRRPRLFRPPYGSFNATTFNELRHLHLLMILWSVIPPTTPCRASRRSCIPRLRGPTRRDHPDARRRRQPRSRRLPRCRRSCRGCASVGCIR